MCTPSFGNEYGELNYEDNNKFNEVHNNMESTIQTEDNILYNIRTKSLKRGRDNSDENVQSDTAFVNVVSTKTDLESGTYDNIMDENKMNHIDNKFYSFEKEQPETYENNSDSKNLNYIDVMDFNIYKEGHKQTCNLPKVSVCTEPVDGQHEKKASTIEIENVIICTNEDEINTTQDIPSMEDERDICASTEVQINDSKEEQVEQVEQVEQIEQNK
ncbi:hypothetical protein PFAG_01138 [Plasmodium falciparum Santa Lucia]|uniref:Uncharacterized protein n=1 Tax=Plasmodium falciparum Santa Lucia TaxID=478859 RepID=W7G389_PLAFA|nr:hypothetical protein PFAG_01138 [Plasmodium falciparum Santa Lucia]